MFHVKHFKLVLMLLVYIISIRAYRKSIVSLYRIHLSFLFHFFFSLSAFLFTLRTGYRCNSYSLLIISQITATYLSESICTLLNTHKAHLISIHNQRLSQEISYLYPVRKIPFSLIVAFFTNSYICLHIF